jgi:hypothetical protein
MNGKRSTVVPAILAVAIAVAVIGFGMYAGIPINQTNTSASVALRASSNSSTGSTSQNPVQATSSLSSSSSSAMSGSPQGQGTLSILLTDPPNVPQGVTKVYVSYRDLEVHVSDAGNQSGWTTLQTAGEVELLGTVNVSQTISAVKIATGDYNQLRFNISAAEVTFQGQNYTAFVQSAELIIPIHHGIRVNASTVSATIIDISPTVINIGSSSTPEFIIRSVAAAYPVPPGSVTTGMQQEGGRTSLVTAGWWHATLQNYTANLVINSASLNATSLKVDVTNTGSNSTQLTLVVVSPLVSALTPDVRGYLPGTFLGSAVFAILPNGSLMPLRFAMPMALDEQSSVSASVFGSAGLKLSAGASAALSYSGPILLGFPGPEVDQSIIMPHQQYLVTVLGTQSIASFVVVAT